MSRLPNPFRNGQGSQQQTPQRPSTPGFLLMTRPPQDSNSFGGPNYHTPPANIDSFIPFSNIRRTDGGNEGERRSSNQRGGRFNHGGGRNGHANTPRFSHSYQQTPGSRIPNRHGQGQSHGYNNTPGGRYNPMSGLSYSTPRGFPGSPSARFNSGNRRGRFGDRRERSFGDFNTPTDNSKSHWNRSSGARGDRGPISSIPIDKFISDSMVADPWSDFCSNNSDSGIQVEEAGPVIVSLEDSEIIIDSDTSAVVENSFSEALVVSDGELDSSPVHDTGSDSPNIATSSTSEKDTGSDSGSDT